MQGGCRDCQVELVSAGIRSRVLFVYPLWFVRTVWLVPIKSLL